MACPNVSHPDWKELVNKIGVREAYREFAKKGEIPNPSNYTDTFKGVNATLKVLGALSTDKMESVYNKFYNSNKDKFYSELSNAGATKEQIALLRQWNESNPTQSLADMQAGIASEMSYTVEIKEATEKKYSNDPDDYDYDYEVGELVGGESINPTSHYQGMTVDGGINYRENEIRTPDITPTRQGHAAFSTPNGIGWFRSDDKKFSPLSNRTDQAIFDAYKKETGDTSRDVPKIQQWLASRREEDIVKGSTRRILEVQSDLFQKERNSEVLAASSTNDADTLDNPFLTEEDYSNARARTPLAQNNFLQLLNKENNWVTFFVKSIIQDSARKGYDNVLFPADQTAAKVEGHETLEQFLANTQNNIDSLERRLKPGGQDPAFNHKLSGIQDAARHNREYVETSKADKLDSKAEHHLNPRTIGSQYNYVRIQQNWYRNGLTENTYSSLTGDNYKGWVLHQYTVGEGRKITKLTDAEAQDLLDKDHARSVQSLKEEYEQQEANVKYMLANKEFIQATERENITREIKALEEEMVNARAGRAQLSSIANFYENTIQNILNKQKYSPTRITDEYGNDWFQVKLKDDYRETIYFNKQESPASFEKRAGEFLQKEGLITKDESKGFVITSNYSGPNVISIQAQNYQRLLEIGNDYAEKYGFNPISITDDGKDYVVKIDGTPQDVFHKDNRAIEAARETTVSLLNHLSDKIGLPFEIITDDQADALLGDESDDNVRAFYKGGKVYMLENHLSPDIAFHEFSHPFIRALGMENPLLYNTLVQQLRDSPEGQELFNSIRENYSHLEGGDTAIQRESNRTQLNDEVLVRALTEVAQGNMSFQSAEGKSFWGKLWFNIKQFFRKMFGQNIELGNLSEKTTLNELSQMLLGTKGIALPRNEVDYTLFNREIAKELTNIPEHDAVKAIETFHRVAQDHLIKMRENRNYNELREVLKNQADGSILTDINKLLALSKQKEEELNDNFKKLTNFSRAVEGAGILSNKMKLHVLEMNNTPMDERDKLRTMRYYSFISNDWLQAFDQLREINKEDLPLLGNEIARASNNFRRINDAISQAFKGGLVATLREQLAPISEGTEEALRPELDKVRKEVEGGNTKLQERLEYLQKMYDHGTFDDAKILKLLQGELGDTNWFSSMFESYTSSPDAVVGGFAAYVNKELYKVEAGIQETSTNMGNELAPLYKQLGVDISKPEELGKQLVFKDTAFTKDENGSPKGHEVYTYLHEFANGYQYDYQNLQHQIDAAKEAGDKPKAIELQKQFDQLRKDYFHREYTDEVYNAKDFWNESDINRLAQQRRKDITDQLAGYEAESNIKDLTEDDRDHIEQLLVELKTLSSTKNLDGSDKTGDDLGVAQAIKEYNQRMMKFREEMPMKGAFERDLQTQKDDLLDKGFDENSDEYKKGLNSWLKSNLRVRLSDLFYDSRNKIIDEISSIVSKLGQDEAKQLDVSNAWKEMFEQIKGFRDQDNQPIGTSLSEDKVRAVKKLQEKINEMTENLRRLNGLTGEESERQSQLFGKLRAGNPLDQAESAEFQELRDKKTALGLSPADRARLNALFDELKEFQSKIPTEYYLEAINQKLKESNVQLEASMNNADELLNADMMDEFMQASPDSAFSKWFEQNHIKRVKWDNGQNKMMYERLYTWNRIVPNDDNFKTALGNNDYQKLLELKNPMVDIKPGSKFFFYRIKNEYRTKREVGKTVDNRGNWLPRTLEQGAKDGKYRNEQYYSLRNSKDPKQQALYKILETYKKYHLKSQEDAPKYTRLGYEIPRIRKERIENIEAALRDPSRSGKNLVSWIGTKIGWKSKSDAFDQGVQSRKDMQREAKMYVATDLFGTEINSIPMKYMSKLESDLVSLDLGRSTIKYTLAQQVNKALHEINPFAQALKQTLAGEGIKSINKISTRNWGSKFMSIPVLDRNNNRLKTINNMIERDIEGIENHMELGLFGSKVSQHLMGVSAFGSLALNIPAGIKNVVVAKLQNLIEANGKEFFGAQNLKKADQLFMKRFMPKLIHDYNSFAGRSLETQMFELFDFVQGKYEEHAGESFSASYKKDIARLRFTRSFQVLGELQAQGQAGIAMMLRQQVPWQHEGKVTMINYLDAWELRNGAIQLKDGVDASWGKQGENFAAFKLKMHKINELMQGAYSKMNQSEATRYTSFKMFNFMRRYLVPGIVNRFTVNRNNVALGTQREGYYAATARLGLDMAKNGLSNWHSYSEKEKRNVYKTLTEIGYSVAFLTLISMMGYNSDDPDKNKKLKGNSWAQNMALYELIMIKGELENFIPIPGMGVNEILRMKDQPSIAFPMINKYYKIISHLLDMIQQPLSSYDLIHYRTSTGIYKKGDLKIIADLLKVVGYTGATLHPDVAIKNYMATTNRYN